MFKPKVPTSKPYEGPAIKPSKPPPKPSKPSNLKFVRALFPYEGQADEGELSFGEGALLFIIDDQSDPNWWKARSQGKEGLVPANYLINSNGQSPFEQNPIHDAARRGNMDLLEECILNKIPVNAIDVAGNTALHWAAHSGHLDCLKRILAVPHVKTSLRNRVGDTPLHHAAWKGHHLCVQALREAEADFEALNEEGQRPMALAQETETQKEFRIWQKVREGSVNQVNCDYNASDYELSDQEDQ
ncbi:hypothetical protein TCAL_06981 [Tigriopus californicus]|uniref:Osteoclast-stimulating factor 1 n=1 Tax=Tigriopus californicus TaxID=6832 RepID=A0A553P8I5_TIGCA|nr:osteoclast-stimulating factor 1-like [Tigriopus californicus]TRY74001.1 hypothetical protein TCAL_06981 [Tigriopus californicus]|eukprot:TCALIF_06981-PA protein Name:"Similar to ostf1 Osteoclast-stimulating factor 1 (Danio rerio)" AED:0.04 eAED:0.04 QI:0/-1/0/1/-1/1/1/0/243